MEMTRLGKKGQVSIPKAVIDRLGLEPETVLLVETTSDGSIMLRPAGVFWSLCPCLLFAFLVSTVNVSGHASYPFWAAIGAAKESPNEAVVLAVGQLEARVLQYTGILASVQTVLEGLLSIWIAIPILRGRTHFPRWLALLIPIFPMLAAMMIDVWSPGFFPTVEPYVASGAMVLAFGAATAVLLRRS